jgi:hypothetical protein
MTTWRCDGGVDGLSERWPGIVMSYFGYLGIQNARRRYLGIQRQICNRRSIWTLNFSIFLVFFA